MPRQEWSQDEFDPAQPGEQDVAEETASEGQLELDAAAEAPVEDEPSDEPVAEEAPADAPGEPETLATHIPMRHPDGGACDRYESDASGVISVPVEDVAVMLDHGFVPAVEG